MKSFDTSVLVFADAGSNGQAVDFDGPYVSGLVITNNSGVSIQYSSDAATWTTVASGATASPAVPDSSAFYLRKMSSGGPAAVRLAWRSGDLDRSDVAITGGRSAGVVGLGAANAMAAAGDSLIAGAVNGGSPYYQAVRRASLPYRDAGNFAVAGTRTDQIASQIPSAAAAGGSVLCMNGGVNDIAQSIAEGTLRANLIANWSAARALQMEPVSIGMPPTNTAGNVPRYVASEVWRKLYCRKNNIRHVDIWSVLATSAGAYQSGLFSDAIHYNSVGAIAAAARLASVLDSPTGRFPALLAMTDTGSDAGGFIQNAISFTDTNADGVPDSWFASGAGGTYTVQPADAGDFGKWARCSLTAGTNVGMTATAVTLASLGWSVGDRIAVAFRIRWTDASQALSVSCNTTGITTSSTQNLFQETGGATGNSLTVYNEQVISGGTTINLAFFASGTGFFEINRPVIVNLTLLGFPNGVA